MISKEQIFVGLRLRDPTRPWGSKVLVVIELAADGFYYTWAERQHFGVRHGHSDGGKYFYSACAFLELADVGTYQQRPLTPGRVEGFQSQTAEGSTPSVSATNS